jgi:hypothetical protein
MVLKNDTHMIKVTDTLSSMLMAAPLTVAAPSALSPDAGAQRFDMHDNTKLVSIGAQLHAGQQWRPNRVKASGNLAPASAEWYGARHCNTGRYRSIADLGVTPAIRRLDDSRTAWNVEDGEDAHQLSAPYNAGWRRRSTAYGFGDHTKARYTTHSGVDIGLSLQHHPAAGHKHPDNAVSFAAMRPHKATWTWTKTAWFPLPLSLNQEAFSVRSCGPGCPYRRSRRRVEGGIGGGARLTVNRMNRCDLVSAPTGYRRLRARK